MGNVHCLSQRTRGVVMASCGLVILLKILGGVIAVGVLLALVTAICAYLIEKFEDEDGCGYQ